ncbi:MAG: hypothetical protein HY319_18070 [Armatimonadetes bacterium]|nr:hypothetical protein [Armatimonadota bacterium]
MAADGIPSPMDRLEQKLIEAVRQEFRRLRREVDFALPDQVLDQLRCGSTRRGTFFSCKKNCQEPTFNPHHHVLRKFLQSPSKSRADLYFLLSAVYSVLNRADPDIEDHHEREFHAKILEELLNGKSAGRWTEAE